MKKIFTLITCALSMPLLAQTQISNPGFENWSTVTEHPTYIAPDNWQDGLICASVNGGPFTCVQTIAQTTDAHSGTYALSFFDLEQSPRPGYQSFSNIEVTEDFDFIGPAFTGRPGSFSFYYKYATDDNQTIKVTVVLYSGADYISGDVIGSAEFNLSDSKSSYTKASADFIYASAEAPTNIVVLVNFSPRPVTASDELKLDDFLFDYTLTAVEEAEAKDRWTVSVANGTIKSSLPLYNTNLVDLTGKTVASFDNAATECQVHELKAGVYIIKGMIDDKPVSKKVFVD